jgi:hypothetical protein
MAPVAAQENTLLPQPKFSGDALLTRPQAKSYIVLSRRSPAMTGWRAHEALNDTRMSHARDSGVEGFDGPMASAIGWGRKFPCCLKSE